LLCRVAQVLSDAKNRIYAIKAQQPRKGWDKAFGTAEKAFEVIARHYELEPHRRGDFKSGTFGWTMGLGSSVGFYIYIGAPQFLTAPSGPA
jgi:hypothetical protein